MKNKKGMTLVEVVVAMAIIAMASVLLVGGIMASLNIIRRGSNIINVNAEAKAELGDNINNKESESLEKVSFSYLGDKYELYQVKAGGLSYYSTEAAKLNTKGIASCIYEVFMEYKNGVITADGKPWGGNSMDSSAHSTAVDICIDRLKTKFGINSDLMFWRIVCDVNTGTFGITFTDVYNSAVFDYETGIKANDYVNVYHLANYDPNSDSNAMEKGYVKIKTKKINAGMDLHIKGEHENADGSREYRVLSTFKSTDGVNVETFFKDSVFDTFENGTGAIYENMFKYFCVNQRIQKNISSQTTTDEFPLIDAVKDYLNTVGITASDQWSYDFNSGNPKFSFGVNNADFGERKAYDYVISIVNNASLTNNIWTNTSKESFCQLTESVGGVLVPNVSKETFSVSDFEKYFDNVDDSHKQTVYNAFNYFMLQNPPSIILDKAYVKTTDGKDSTNNLSINSEKVSDEVKNQLKYYTGLDSSNCLWTYDANNYNKELTFTYTRKLNDKASVKKYDIIEGVKTEVKPFATTKVTTSEGWLLVTAADSSDDIALYGTIDSELITQESRKAITAILRGFYAAVDAKQAREKTDSEPGYNQDGTFNTSTGAGWILNYCKNNFKDVDLSKYYFRITANSSKTKVQNIYIIPKSEVTYTDSDKKIPDLTKKYKVAYIDFANFTKSDYKEVGFVRDVSKSWVYTLNL